MRVTKTSHFEPITIVLETEDEAYAMYHRLNAACGVFDGGDVSRLIKVQVPMWDKFSAVYFPNDD